MTTPRPPEDIPLIKRQIEEQLDDYAIAIAHYAAFLASWRARRDALTPEPAE